MTVRLAAVPDSDDAQQQPPAREVVVGQVVDVFRWPSQTHVTIATGGRVRSFFTSTKDVPMDFERGSWISVTMAHGAVSRFKVLAK